MNMRLVRHVIVCVVISGFVLGVSGCGTISTSQSDVRNVPNLVRAKLSIGDSRQKVHSILGDPLVDARSHGVEVYRLSGRDLDLVLTPFPVPLPGEKVTVVVLVVYDESDKVKDIAVDTFDKYFSFRITAGGFRFVNNSHDRIREPETLLGPPISWEEITDGEVPEGKCSLILLMGECPMEIISLDNNRIANFSPAGSTCGALESEYFGAYFQNNISPGVHYLQVHQGTAVKDRDFEARFECGNGEIVYAELKVTPVRKTMWSLRQLEGELSVSKTPPKKHIVGVVGLSPILWHRGSWYGPPTMPSRDGH